MAKRKIKPKPAETKQATEASKPEPRLMHLPDEPAEKAALAESYYRHAYQPCQLRLRDLLIQAAAPDGAHNFEPLLDDPEDYREATLATQALDSIADELEVLALALDSAENISDEHLLRVIVRLSKRARAASELARRLDDVPPVFVPDSDPAKTNRVAS